MTNFFKKILSFDLADKYYFQRPSSGWILAGLPNLEIKIMRIRGVPIGAGIQLPSDVIRSRWIFGLTHHETQGYAFEDNLCFFRCLAYHLGSSLRCLEGPANRLKERLEEHTGKSFDDGVEVSMLPIIEKILTLISTYILSKKTRQVRWFNYLKQIMKPLCISICLKIIFLI